MVPPEIVDAIQAEFPQIRIMPYESDFMDGLGVEILTDGKLLRNGWVVDTRNPDWETVRNDALQWLRQVTSNG
jgi:hypothetical protein